MKSHFEVTQGQTLRVTEEPIKHFMSLHNDLYFGLTLRDPMMWQSK